MAKKEKPVEGTYVCGKCGMKHFSVSAQLGCKHEAGERKYADQYKELFDREGKEIADNFFKMSIQDSVEHPTELIIDFIDGSTFRHYY